MNKNNHRRALSNNDFQQILSSKIAGLVEENSYKNLHKNQSFGNVLFQIPEQTDIASSTEQSLQSGKKGFNSEFQLSAKKYLSQDQKENIKNQNTCLISQIQYMIKGSHPIKEITSKAVNNERNENSKQLSFTNELQKKNSQIFSNSKNESSSLTPDKKRIDNNNSKLTNYQQRSDQQQFDGSEKSKIELSNSLLNSILKVDQKKKPTIEQKESFRKMEIQMTKIQKDINTIKKRQDQLDQFNRNIQSQLFDFMNESKKQQDYGYQSLKKLEQLELITRRNEESIRQIKQKLLDDQPIQMKGNENIINFGNLTSYKQENDIQKKYVEFRYVNKISN